MANQFPTGYFGLRLNAEYIVMDGKAVPIRGLSGHRMVSSFYPNGGSKGYPIHRRVATVAEKIADELFGKMEADEPASPAPSTAGFDISDWR